MYTRDIAADRGEPSPWQRSMLVARCGEHRIVSSCERSAASTAGMAEALQQELVTLGRPLAAPLTGCRVDERHVICEHHIGSGTLTELLQRSADSAGNQLPLPMLVSLRAAVEVANGMLFHSDFLDLEASSPLHASGIALLGTEARVLPGFFRAPRRGQAPRDPDPGALAELIAGCSGVSALERVDRERPGLPHELSRALREVSLASTFTDACARVRAALDVTLGERLAWPPPVVLPPAELVCAELCVVSGLHALEQREAVARYFSRTAPSWRRGFEDFTLVRAAWLAGDCLPMPRAPHPELVLRGHDADRRRARQLLDALDCRGSAGAFAGARRALSLDPGWSAAWFTLAELHQQAGDTVGAAFAIAEAICAARGDRSAVDRACRSRRLQSPDDLARWLNDSGHFALARWLGARGPALHASAPWQERVWN